MVTRIGCEAFFENIMIKIVSRVVIIVRIVHVWTGCQIVWIGERLAVTIVIVVPWVGRVSIESLRPEKNFILIMHSVLVIVLIEVITNAVVIVIPWRNEFRSIS